MASHLSFSLRLMLLPALLILSAAALTPQSADAQPRGVITSADMDVNFVPRLSLNEAEFAITTREGSIDLLLTDTAIYIQFSNEGLKKIDKEIKNETTIDSSHFAEVLTSMISSGIQTLLDRAMAIPLYEISEISYSDGTLVIKNRDGKEIFKDIEIENRNVMQDFSRRDARNFAGHAERYLD